MNLGVGAYRDDNNKPVVIKSVADATKRIFDAKMNNEYAPIAGEPEFAAFATKLAFGENSPLLKEGRVAAIQSVSGTGALRLIGAYLARFWPEGTPKPKVYLPNPTWVSQLSSARACARVRVRCTAAVMLSPVAFRLSAGQPHPDLQRRRPRDDVLQVL